MSETLEVFGNAIGVQTLTVADSAVGFTATNYKNVIVGNGNREIGGGHPNVDARAALITADGTAGTNDVRWTVNGTTPVAATTGHLLQAKQSLFIKGLNNIIKFRAIREGGTSGTLQVTFFG